MVLIYVHMILNNSQITVDSFSVIVRMAEASSSQGPNVYDVDTTNHSRGLWLLKVPKYLAEQWQGLDNGTDIGSIEFVKSVLLVFINNNTFIVSTL